MSSGSENRELSFLFLVLFWFEAKTGRIIKSKPLQTTMVSYKTYNMWNFDPDCPQQKTTLDSNTLSEEQDSGAGACNLRCFLLTTFVQSYCRLSVSQNRNFYISAIFYIFRSCIFSLYFINLSTNSFSF